MAKLFRFTFQIAGGARFDRGLSLAADQVDLRIAAPALREIFNRNRKIDFHREGAHSGPKWKPLEPDYRRNKLRLFPGKTILRRTDNLYASLSNPNHPDAIFSASKNTVVMGTSDHKAVYHQFGGTHLPERPPLRMNEAEKRAYMKAIHEKMVEAYELTNRGGTLARMNVPGTWGGAGRAWAADD